MPPPEFAAGAVEALVSDAAALDCPLDPTQAGQLLAYLELLVKWNQVHNLTAVRHPDDMLVQHLLDCLAVVAPLRRHLTLRSSDIDPMAGTEMPVPSNATSSLPPSTLPRLPATFRVLDVGSGAGLPGIVIAVALPQVQITCVDAVAKKTAFVTQVQAELRLPNLHARHARVEQLRLPAFDVITSRALGSLAELVQWTRGLLQPRGAWMAMKGVEPAAEIAQLAGAAEVFHVEHLQVPRLKAERCLVWMR
jgi:16S rRNA (guanine527-N7)-methyltransferase